MNKERCTELKIKDVLLYEGDVFRFTSHDKYVLSDFTAVVIWMPQHACFGYKVLTDEMIRTEYPFYEHHELELDLLQHCEIISNPSDNTLEMKWNYRILAHEQNNEIYLQIHRVHYNESLLPYNYSELPCSIGGDDVDELSTSLHFMKGSTYKPILWAGEKFPNEYKK